MKRKNIINSIFVSVIALAFVAVFTSCKGGSDENEVNQDSIDSAKTTLIEAVDSLTVKDSL